jgi:DNA-binding transcriptional LysR family regulator
MEPIPPADMVLFASVVREGSFTRAALALGLTKQAVSERIARLEGRLGVRLLERTTRRLRVTDEGAVYEERCAAIAALIEEANNEVLARRVEPIGLLRVSAPALYGRRFLAPVIADILLRYPRMRLQVVLADRRVDLVEEGFDLAIRVGALDDSSFTARKLGDGYVYLVASPRLLTKRGAPVRETLAELPAIGLRPVDTWSLGGERIKVRPALVVNDLEVACEAAIAGVGIALLPSIVCRNALLDGRLEALLGREPTASIPVHVVFPSRRYLPPKVRVFLDALSTLIEPMAPIQYPPPSRSA